MTPSPHPSVLLVGSFLSARRATRCFSEDLAIHLRDVGWRVSVTSSVESRLLRPLDMARTAWRRRREYEIAHVEVYSGAAFLWAELTCFALHGMGKPYVLSLRGGNLPRFARRWPARMARLLRSARAVIVPSPYLLEEMRPFRADLMLVPNSLDLPRYAFRPRVPATGSLVWMRAFHRIYNPALAPRMMALLVQDFPEMRLRMIGPDMRDGSLQATAGIVDALGLGNVVHVGGPVPKGDVPDCLGPADIFVNTPDVDNTPVSVLEALACGLCVVSTDAGGLRYLLRHEHDALLAPRGDAEALAAAVRRILTTPALAEHLSRNGRKTAEQFAWSRILPEWDRVLTTAAQASGA